jgi:hypothetical protein
MYISSFYVFTQDFIQNGLFLACAKKDKKTRCEKTYFGANFLFFT